MNIFWHFKNCLSIYFQRVLPLKIFAEIVTFSWKLQTFRKIGKGPPCEYFQQILEVSFDFSAILQKKYKGPLFENIKRGVLGCFRWNCKMCQKISKGSTLIKFPKIVLAYTFISIFYSFENFCRNCNRFWKRQKYKGPLFENTKRGVLGYFHWNCIILKVSKNILVKFPKIQKSSGFPLLTAEIRC